MPYKDKEKNKKYQKQYRKKYYIKNKKIERERIKIRKQELLKWFREYKSQLYCIKCGENDIACIDFHHKKDKIYSVTDMVHRGWSKENILKEIHKCVVLCANCHRKLHYKADVA